MKITKATRADFVETHNLYSDKIFRMCFFKTQDKELAMDLTQQAFLKLWECYKEGQVVENPKALVYRITHNLIVDWYRKKKAESLDKLMDAGFDPHDKGRRQDILDYAEFENTMNSLEKLSPAERELIILRYMEDFTPREIAHLTHKRENAISVGIHRAVKNLKGYVRLKYLHKKLIKKPDTDNEQSSNTENPRP